MTKTDRNLFVGREAELQQLTTTIASSRGGIIIVEGNVGVGKTSFVNVTQYDKWKSTKERFLPSFEKIEVTEQVDTTQFMLSVLSNLVYNLERAEGEEVTNREAVLKEAKELVATTLRSSWGAQLSIAGFGGGFSRQTTFSHAVSTLLPTILNLMNRWVECVTSKLGYEGIMVPIDNLDVLPDDFLTGFLNRMRDTLIDRPSVWWIVIGRTGFFSLLERDAHRVSELVTGRPVNLKPLSIEQVLSAINRRVELYRLDSSARPPVAEDVIRFLYDVSGGEIRYIFKRTSDVVLTFRSLFPTEKQIPTSVAIENLLRFARQKVEEAQLNTKEFGVLRKMSSTEEFRTRDYADFDMRSPQALNKYITKFSKLGFLVRKETKGKAVFYRTTGDVNLFFIKETE